MPRDIKIIAKRRVSRPLANPVGSSPGRFAKNRESALMPLSPGNIFATNPPTKPVGSLGIARGSTPRAGH